MTTTVDRDIVDVPTEPDLVGVDPTSYDEGPDRPAGVLLSCSAVALATAAAAWLLAGVFAGALPKVVAMLAAVAGPALVAISYRTRRPAVVQYLALPIAAAAGAALVVPATTGGSANLPSLVAEAVRSGGLSQPPVPFEPGWRFLLVVLVTLLGTGAAALAAALDKPRLGIAVPLPVVVAASLVQPPRSAVAATVVALVLLVAALVLSSGAQLMQDGSSSGSFEARRLLRGLGGLVLLGVTLGALSQAGFLFPAQPQERVIPPKRPQTQPPLSDRVLFSVDVSESPTTADPGPWRFGVIDVYDEVAWLLPPVDRARMVDVPPSGRLGDAVRGRPLRPDDGPPAIPAATGTTRSITFRVGDLPGRVLPTVEGQVAVDARADLELDPRTQTLRSRAGRAVLGTEYTVTAALPPSAKDLAAIAAGAPDALGPFVDAPEPPTDVATLIAAAPTSPFERLQFVRNALYAKVVAAGRGTPVDVPPARVAEMLNGAEATPYEITAAEALLARWAGVPARIGFGFYAGTRSADGTSYDVHPRDAATWLEAYFDGPGWITVVGRPPRAKASTDLDQKNQDPQLRASEDLALVVRVPVELESLRQLYDDVRFYLLVSVPWLLLAVLVIVFYPALVKVARRWRRRRWAREQGLGARLLVAYAELRDRLLDVRAPNPASTPLEFVAAIEPDDEHWELAWLTTRALWGDLRRDLRLEDVEAAEDMARSVAQRVLRAQRPLVRALGQASRASLREPYTDDVPNLWPSGPRVGVRIRRRTRAILRRPARRGLRRGATSTAGVVALVIVATTLLSGCGGSGSRASAPALPTPLVPEAVGEYRLQREPSAEAKFAEVGDAALVTDGHVYTVRRGGEVLGSLQAATFKPSVRGDIKKIQKGLRKSIGTGDFTLRRIGTEPVYVLVQNELRILLWFPPGGGYYEMLDARQGFDDAERVFLALLNFQRGRSADLGSDSAVVDVRRGGDA